MNVGLSVESRIPGLNGSDLIDAIVERAQATDEAGLASLHLGDRHQVDQPYVANLAMAARLAASWPKRLGVLVISSVWNPVLLAEQLATLSAMTSELDVVVAMGDGEAHFASVGVPISDRLALFTDGLAVTQALLAGEAVTARVGPHNIVDARVDLRGNSAISWLIAASAPKAIRRAAALGLGWLGSAKLAPHDALEALDIYRQAGGTGPAVLRRDIYVGTSPEDVRATVDPVVAAGHRGYPDAALMRGTVAQVGEELQRWQQAGFNELLARSLAQTQLAALESIHRLGESARFS